MFGYDYVALRTKRLLRGEINRRTKGSVKDSKELISYLLYHMYRDAGWRERDVLLCATRVDVVETEEDIFVLRFITYDFSTAEYLFFGENENARWVG